VYKHFQIFIAIITCLGLLVAGVRETDEPPPTLGSSSGTISPFANTFTIFTEFYTIYVALFTFEQP